MRTTLHVAIATTCVFVVAACAAQPAAYGHNNGLADPTSNPRCAFGGPPTVLKREGNAILQFWTFPETNIYASAMLPADLAFAEYRHAIELAGADLRRPIADKPQPTNDAERQVWVGEEKNVELAYSGRAGIIRPMQCLDALLFAYQNERYLQLSHPTEFIASILRKRMDGRAALKIYFAASDMLFPPQGFYGFNEIKRDLTADWEFWTVLHNHTIQRNNGDPALGVPAPSTSDIDLLRSLATNNGLQNAWITNGFFTIEVPARAFEHYAGRP